MWSTCNSYGRGGADVQPPPPPPPRIHISWSLYSAGPFVRIHTVRHSTVYILTLHSIGHASPSPPLTLGEGEEVCPPPLSSVRGEGGGGWHYPNPRPLCFFWKGEMYWILWYLGYFRFCVTGWSLTAFRTFILIFRYKIHIVLYNFRVILRFYQYKSCYYVHISMLVLLVSYVIWSQSVIWITYADRV